MEKLENKLLQVTISPKGAELQNILFKEKEMLWQGDPAWWARRSPVLFPVVGKCASDTIRVSGKTYPMSQHGFARDADFTLSSAKADYLKFTLNEAKPNFPFDYELEIAYFLKENGLRVAYTVRNTGSVAMPFSIGAHPGFCLPSGRLDDYRIQFEKPENDARHLLDNGLFNGKKIPVFTGQKIIPLSDQLFELDAIVLKDINSRSLELLDKSGPLLEMSWENMPHMGLWTKTGCQDFICLEPWAGYADAVGYTGEFSQKAATSICQAGESRSFAWEVYFNA